MLCDRVGVVTECGWCDSVGVTECGWCVQLQLQYCQMPTRLHRGSVITCVSVVQTKFDATDLNVMVENPFGMISITSASRNLS